MGEIGRVSQNQCLFEKMRINCTLRTSEALIATNEAVFMYLVNYELRLSPGVYSDSKNKRMRSQHLINLHVNMILFKHSKGYRKQRGPSLHLTPQKGP